VQNTLGVSAVHAVPLEIVRGQIAAVAEDLMPAACKTGMLATRDLVSLVAASLREHGLTRYVLDPVMVATSGDRLLDHDAQGAVLTELVPLAALVTPNLDEATILAGFEVHDVASMRRAAQTLVAAGAGAALVKGGHLRADELVDVLYDGQQVREFRRPRIATRSTHGTGCTLSAAVTALLAQGNGVETAVEQALEFVHRAIARAPRLGRGSGPLNHFVALPSAPTPHR
jgi:hydroxymethylpyrimidine/phosphomethylpyrimidine kinase